MKYKIVADSSCDLNKEIKEKVDIDLVPFNISVDDEHFRDDESLNVNHLIQAMKNSPNPVKTSCPSPGDFLEKYKEGDNVFAVTISANLSGTYNSALLAKDMAMDSDSNKFVHVFNSKSASIGETLIALKIDELIKKGLGNMEIVTKVEEYIGGMKTFFILESLDNLIKNGRISKTKGIIASVLNFKPIMGSDEEGNIKLIENHRGTKKSFNRLVELIGETGKDFQDKILAISHANAIDKALGLKEKIEKIYNFKEVIVVETKGLSTAYANDGGVILAY
ncbi:DegV family protein [Wansuia hejianensis]|uniref:DegV family protein n=1 Tax=Wansuia hejianensis TaxID=2763667 RepID=A0A926INJ0_9FIRM|nr:DegV family protein [Wansuia hejianensis]MBC8591510.1 DegV family protein [Wansuia hejianensis]